MVTDGLCWMTKGASLTVKLSAIVVEWTQHSS